MRNGISTSKLQKVFLKSAEGQALTEVASYAMAGPLSGDLEARVNRAQSGWKPLSERYSRYKANNNLDSRIWVATGKTLKALSSGQPKPKVPSTTKGMAFLVEKSRLVYYLEPRTMSSKGRGKRDAFYANNSRRQLFFWSSADRTKSMMNFKRGVDAVFSKSISQNVGGK